MEFLLPIFFSAGLSLRKTLETTRSTWRKSPRWWEKKLQEPFSHFQILERPFKNELYCSCLRTCVCVCFVYEAMLDCKTEPFENHSALEIAEQLTLLDHLVFKVIPYEWVPAHVHGYTEQPVTGLIPERKMFSIVQGVLWSGLDEIWQERENTVHYENDQAF